MRKLLFISLLLSLLSLNVNADEANFNETIVRIINQINAINPLVDEARSQQANQARIQLHLAKYTGSDNKIHNGLQDDLNAIKKSLVAYLNKPAIEPRKITPLALDYIDAPKGVTSHG